MIKFLTRVGVIGNSNEKTMFSCEYSMEQQELDSHVHESNLSDNNTPPLSKGIVMPM